MGGALYYPYIHVRDDNWLKATLLCFPYLERMVPRRFELNDTPLSAFFADVRQDRPSLLRQRDLHGDAYANAARAEIWGRLKLDVRNPRLELLKRFSREAAQHDPKFSDGANAFQIHEGKFDHGFFDWLQQHHLIWPTRGRNAQWYGVHPELGETIMSAYAVALAAGHDLEIVTSQPAIHEALLSADVEDVYERLVLRQPSPVGRDDDQKVTDLMRFVIATDLDLTNVPPDKIVELAQENESISDLKQQLSKLVADVGRAPDREVWEDGLRQRADKLVRDWYESKKLFRQFAQTYGGRLLKEGEEAAFKGALPAVGAGAAAALTASLASLLPGLAVGAVIMGGTLLYNRRRNPYRFLSTLVDAGADVRHPAHLLAS